MNKKDFLYFLYQNNYNNVYEHAINVCKTWGLGYAISNISGPLPPTQEPITVWQYIIEHPEDCTINCGNTENESIKIISPHEDNKTQYNGIYGENDEQVNNVIEAGPRFFAMGVIFEELEGIGEDAQPSILNNWKSVGLSYKDNSFNPSNSYYFLENDIDPFIEIRDYYPAPDETDYEDEIVWFGTANYIAKGQSPYAGEQSPAGEYIFDKYIENNANALYICGDRQTNKLMFSMYDGQQDEIKYSPKLTSPINLNRVLFVNSGIIWKTSLPNYDCTYNLTFATFNINGEYIKTWLEHYLL